MIDFVLTRITTAPIDIVFDKLTDHRAYKDMSPLRISELERAGHPEPNGMGAIRRVGVVGPTQTELPNARVIDHQPKETAHVRIGLRRGRATRSRHRTGGPGGSSPRPR